MTRTLVTLGHLIVLAILAQSMMVLAQSISARGEILRAEPPKISNTRPLTRAFERRRESLPLDEKGGRQRQAEIDARAAEAAARARIRAEARARIREAERIRAEAAQARN
jgi:hypothetical protein